MPHDRVLVVARGASPAHVTALRAEAATGQVWGVACPGGELRTVTLAGVQLVAVVVPIAVWRNALKNGLPGSASGWRPIDILALEAGADPFEIDPRERAKAAFGAGGNPVVIP